MTESQPKQLYVFDFDGTITTKDTFALFLRYYAGNISWALKILQLLPTFIAYKCKIIDRHSVKKAVIWRFFKNEPKEQVIASAERFAADVIPSLIRPKAQARLDELLKGPNSAPESLYICSASISPYLKAWARSCGIQENHVLAVELQSDSCQMTGRIDGYNVWGSNKVRRIRDEFNPHSVEIKEAYGDSEGDRELLHAAQASFYRPFRV